MIIVCPLFSKRYCVNIFGTFWTGDKSWIDRFVINHERIHTAQQKELAWIPFYIIYGIEWLVRFIIYRSASKAYMSMSFEREAYDNGHDLTYLSRRRHYAQWRKPKY